MRPERLAGRLAPSVPTGATEVAAGSPAMRRWPGMRLWSSPSRPRSRARSASATLDGVSACSTRAFPRTDRGWRIPRRTREAGWRMPHAELPRPIAVPRVRVRQALGWARRTAPRGVRPHDPFRGSRLAAARPTVATLARRIGPHAAAQFFSHTTAALLNEFRCRPPSRRTDACTSRCSPVMRAARSRRRRPPGPAHESYRPAASASPTPRPPGATRTHLVDDLARPATTSTAGARRADEVRTTDPSLMRAATHAGRGRPLRQALPLRPGPSRAARRCFGSGSYGPGPEPAIAHRVVEAAPTGTSRPSTRVPRVPDRYEGDHHRARRSSDAHPPYERLQDAVDGRPLHGPRRRPARPRLPPAVDRIAARLRAAGGDRDLTSARGSQSHGRSVAEGGGVRRSRSGAPASRDSRSCHGDCKLCMSDLESQ